MRIYGIIRESGFAGCKRFFEKSPDKFSEKFKKNVFGDTSVNILRENFGLP